MNWHDFFYFSKEERIALSVLLSIILLAWIAILFSHSYEEPLVAQNLTDNRTISDSSLIIIPPQKNKQIQLGIHKQYKLNRDKHSSFTPYLKTNKFPRGTIIELNSADTTTLKKIPGIGSVFARRIVKYRNLLGGFYTIEQLSEVYGIDEQRYEALKLWFKIDTSYITKLNINQLTIKELAKHPYISYKQAQVMYQLKRKKGHLKGWENLSLLDEFSKYDHERLLPYLSFQ